MPSLFVILLSFILLSPPAHAQEVTAEMSEAYYNSCIRKERPPALTKEGQDSLCACTASKMLENMTLEDIKDLSNEEQAIRRDAFNYMLVTVYAPCMEQPTKDYYYHTCRSNPKSRLITTDSRVMCKCISEKVSKYVRKKGPEIFADILTRNPNIQDPMGALESDPVFQSYVKKQGVACLF